MKAAKSRIWLNRIEDNKIFKEICADYLGKDSSCAHNKPGKEPEKPVMVILSGQPGAGKSSTMKKPVCKAFEEKGEAYLDVDHDDLNIYHPSYPELVKANDKTSAALVVPFVRPWFDKLVDKAIGEKRNIIIDYPITDVGGNLARIKKAKKLGYEVQVHAIAVDGRKSIQGIRGRYEKVKQLRRENPDKQYLPRWVPRIAHDYTINIQSMAIANIEKSGLADSVYVWARGKNEPIYVNKFDGQEKTAKSAANALTDEQSRPWTYEEKVEFAQSYDEIVKMMEERGAGRNEMKTVRKAQKAAHNAVENHGKEVPKQNLLKSIFSRKQR